MTKTAKLTYFIISTIFFVAFDIYFSELILNDLRFKLVGNPVLDLISINNTGAAFSILENATIFLIAFSIIAVGLIFGYAFKNAEKFSAISGFWTAMLIAGICCNLYERINYGYVRDFFKLNFIDFPVFNISDIFINIGVLALIVIIVKNKYLKK